MKANCGKTLRTLYANQQWRHMLGAQLIIQVGQKVQGLGNRAQRSISNRDVSSTTIPLARPFKIFEQQEYGPSGRVKIP